MRNAAVGFIIMLVINVIVVAGFRGGADRADAGNPRLVAQGQRVYTQACASCHGANLEGQPNWKTGPVNGPLPAPPHNASGHTWHHADPLLFAIVKLGGQASAPPGYTSGMPAFGTMLSDAEIWAVLAYIKSSWPPELQAAQESVNRQPR